MSNNIVKSFAKHLNKLRVERNLSFQEMALACDMDKAHVYKICTQGRDVSLSTIVKLAEGLGLAEGELFKFKR